MMLVITHSSSFRAVGRLPGEPVLDTIIYFGVKCFGCSHDYAKRSYRWPANSIFGKIDRIASEESVL